ncbi:MAG: aminopeptidase, partial [Desulfobacula sp.]|nr:aminopeptidase [Desulfobacula sp.]
MNKTEIKKLKKRVLKKNTLVFDQFTKQEKTRAFQFSESYKDFLDKSKTEREAAKQIIHMAKDNGFLDIDTLLTKKQKASKKIYKVFQGRCVAMAVMGKTNLISGTNIIASHIDSPRLDLKQNPIYEDLSL